MSGRWVGLVAAVALIFIAILAWRDRAAQRRLGQRNAEIAALRADSIRKASEVRRADTVFTRDTIRLAQIETRWRTRTDSLLRVDTLTLREQIIIGTADSVINACRAVVTSCEARVAARDSLITTLGQQREAERRLAAARLRAASPRLLPYVEAGLDPLHQWSATGRAGLEVRAFGPFRLTAALVFTQSPTTTTSAAVGVRMTF